MICSVTNDLNSYLAAQDRAEAHGEYMDSLIPDAFDRLLSRADDGDTLNVLQTERGDTSRSRELHEFYSAHTGDCRARSHDEWVRAMLLCEPEHVRVIRHNWREWSIEAVAEYPAVVKEAERMEAEEVREGQERLADIEGY